MKNILSQPVQTIAVGCIALTAYLQCMFGFAGYFALFQSPDWIYSVHGVFLLQSIVLIGVATALLINGFKDGRSILFGLVALLIATEFSTEGQLYFSAQFNISIFKFLESIKLVPLFPYFFWRFARAFPQAFVPPKLNIKIDWIEKSTLLIGLFLIADNVLSLIFPQIDWMVYSRENITGEIHSLLSYGLSIPALFLLWYKMGRAREDERRRVRIFITGLTVSLIPPLVYIILTSVSVTAKTFLTHENVSIYVFPFMQLCIIATPIITSYAVLVERALPMRMLLKQTVRYSLGHGFVILAIAAPLLLFSLYLYQMRSLSISALFEGANGIFLAITLGLSLWVFGRRTSAHHYLEELFYREKYNTNNVLSELSLSIQTADSLSLLCTFTKKALEKTLHPESAHLLFISNESYLRDPRQELAPLSLHSPFGNYLKALNEIIFTKNIKTPLSEEDRSWLTQSHATLIIPILRKSSNVGLLLVGWKKSELPFSEADVNFLKLVSDSISLTYSNAQGAWQFDIRSSSSMQCQSCGMLSNQQQSCSNCGQSDFVSSLLPMTLHDHYEVRKSVGSGGMATVYLAIDVLLGRKVALKSINTTNVDELRYLRNEARLMATLSHQNIAAIFGYESYEGMPILVCEFLENGTLADVIREGYLNKSEILDILHQVGAAIGYLHERGITHGDIKPSNIGFSENDTPKLLDFGLAGVSHIKVKNADLNQVGGTYSYMSPEQFRGAKIDQLTDLWAFAVTLYEAMYGFNLFAADSIDASSSRIMNSDQLVLSSSKPISKFFGIAFASDATMRPQSIKEFVKLADMLV